MAITNEMVQAQLDKLSPENKKAFNEASLEKRKEFINAIAEGISSQEQDAPEVQSLKSGVVGLGSDIAQGRGMESLKAMGKQAKEDVLGIAEGATGGLVRGAIEKTTGKDLKGYRGSLQGQAVGFMAGPGKIAGAIGKKAGAKVLGKMGMADDVLKAPGVQEALKRGFLGKALKPAIVKGATEGAVAGTLGGIAFPQEDPFDIGKRVLTGVASGALSAGIGAVTAGAGALQQAKKLTSMAKRVNDNLNKIRERKVSLFEGGKPLESFDVKAETPFKIQGENARNVIRGQRAGVKQSLANKKSAFMSGQNASKATRENNLSVLQSVKTDLEDAIVNGSDEAVTKVKELFPQYAQKNYQWYREGLDEIISNNMKSGKSISAQAFFNDIDDLLKKKMITGDGGAIKRSASGPTEQRLLDLWKRMVPKDEAGKIDLSKQISGNLDLKEILRERMKIRNSIQKNVLSGSKSGGTGSDLYGRFNEIIGKNLDDGGASIKALNKEYSNFARLRDFADDYFEIRTGDIQKGRKFLANATQKGFSESDLGLDVDAIRKLKTLEKEMGVPFLDKLRQFSGRFDELGAKISNLEKMAMESGGFDETAVAKSLMAQDEVLANTLSQIDDKVARSEAILDAMKRRSNLGFKTISESINIPEVRVNQMAQAAYAYVLAITLGGVLKKKDINS